MQHLKKFYPIILLAVSLSDPLLVWSMKGDGLEHEGRKPQKKNTANTKYTGSGKLQKLGCLAMALGVCFPQHVDSQNVGHGHVGGDATSIEGDEATVSSATVSSTTFKSYLSWIKAFLPDFNSESDVPTIEEKMEKLSLDKIGCALISTEDRKCRPKAAICEDLKTVYARIKGGAKTVWVVSV